MPELIPPEWPGVWQSLNVSPAIGTDAKRVFGARVVQGKNGALTYCCTCGESFTRLEGELILEAQEWVKFHKDHLPPEEQIDHVPT